MTSGNRKIALALIIVVVAAVLGYRIFFRGPMLMWDGSPGATSYEVQIDGTLLGTFTETQARLPRGFVTADHAVQVRACTGTACSAWQPLSGR